MKDGIDVLRTLDTNSLEGYLGRMYDNNNNLETQVLKDLFSDDFQNRILSTVDTRLRRIK